MRRPSVLLLVAVLALGGCGSDARTPSVPGPGGPHTAVTPRQAAMIIGAVDAALVRATTARNPAAAGGRLVGPAREALAATLTVDKALKRTPAALPAPTTPHLLLTRTDGWPRWFLTAGATPASATPVLRVLTSSDARSPYGLWGQLSLLPGVALPETAPATTGATPFAPDAPGLARTPTEVLAHYAELLNRGDASAYRDEFAVDVYRTELNNQLGADRRLFLSAGAGQVVAGHTLAAGAPYALPTVDGGAIVIGRIDQSYVVTVAAGRGAVRLDAQLAALAGRPTVTRRIERRTVELLAFHVPRAGSTAKITLLAAGRTDVSATGS